MNHVYIIEANGGSETFGWYPVFMRSTLEMAEIAIKPLLKRWPDAYRIVEYQPSSSEQVSQQCKKGRYCGQVAGHKPRRPDGTLRSSRA